jgi:hypothetical protein
MEGKQMKIGLRIVAKVCLLLVILGFFMPVACEQNGFELAKFAFSGQSGSDMSLVGVALYALFAFACLGGILLFVLSSKTNLHIGLDWLATLGAATSAVVAFIKGPVHDFSKFQTGAYVIMFGLALSLVILFIASVPEEAPAEKDMAQESGGGET